MNMMNTMPTKAKTVSNQIPSLLIPVANGQLILPTVSVAEMLPYKKPQMRDTQINELPGWFLGHVLWRGVMVPMVSYEAINGNAIPALQLTSQMTILNNTGVSAKLPFLCFPTQGIPRLSRVTPELIKEDAATMLKPYDDFNVVVNDEFATIPALEKLEGAVVELLGF
jgi:chemosensory pili system protein ChpC